MLMKCHSLFLEIELKNLSNLTYYLQKNRTKYEIKLIFAFYIQSYVSSVNPEIFPGTFRKTN